MDWKLYNEWFWSKPDYPFVWLFTIIVLFYLSYKMYKMSIIEEFLKSSNRLFQGYSIFFICYGLTRVFFLLSDFHVNYEDYNNEEYKLFIKLGYIVSGIGFAWLIRGFEAHFVDTKYAISSALILLTISIIFLPYEIYQILTYSMGVIIVILLTLVYILAFLKAQGPVKRRLFKATLYTIIFYICVVLDSRMYRNIVKNTNARWTAYILPAFLMIYSLTQMTINIPYIDPSQWFYHLWVIEDNQGDVIYESGYKSLEMKSDELENIINKLSIFCREMQEGNLSEISISKYLFFLLKFNNFSIICASKDSTKKIDIKYFLIQIGERFKDEYPIILGNEGDIKDDFRHFSSIIAQIMRKKPIEIEPEQLEIKF
jgi:hypothetical protein